MFEKFWKPLSLVIAISVLLNGATWLVALLLFPQGGPIAILHYSVPLGVDFIGESRQIYVLPLVGLVILAGNAALGWVTQRPSLRAAWVLWATLPGVQTIFLVAAILLWQFNR